MAQDSKQKGSIRIARVEKADQQAVMELARRAHEESIFRDLPFSEKKYSALFDRCVSQPGRCLGLKAEVNGEIAGFLYCNLGEYYIADEGVIASVNVIYCTEELRKSLLGGKVAALLVRSVARWAKAQGAYLVTFYVTSGIRMSSTDKFFRRMGLTTLGGNYAIRV